MGGEPVKKMFRISGSMKKLGLDVPHFAKREEKTVHEKRAESRRGVVQKKEKFSPARRGKEGLNSSQPLGGEGSAAQVGTYFSTKKLHKGGGKAGKE